MADIFDINFQTQVNQLLPLTKRKPKILAFIYCLIYPIQWLRDRLLDDYKKGATYADWTFFVYYTKGDRLRWTDNKIYEALLDTPFSGFPSPANTNYWLLVQDNFIGTDERVKYNSQIIVLEYALNRWFKAATIDPQIYIQNNSVVSTSFVMGVTSPYSSTLANNSAFANNYLGNSYSAISINNFTVFVPVALFSTLGTNTQNRENNVRQFVDKYKLSGITYDVQTF